MESVGFYGVAKNLAFDEDVTVRHKMVQTLEYLKTCRHFAAPDAFHQRNSLSSHNDSSNNLEMSSETLPPNDDDDDELMTDIKDKLINIESVLDTTDISTVQQIMAPIKTDRRCTNLNELLSKHHRHPGSVSTTDFLNWLNNLNIVSFLLQSDITTDPYNARPELLLDDILLDSYESEHEQENIRDCY